MSGEVINGINGSNYVVDNLENTGDFEEIKIPVPWGHISGKWWGSKSKQPILAIHGWQDNAGTFDNLAPLLKEKGLSLLCIDLPGHGFSSHLPPGQFYYLWWDGIHIVRRIVKHFKWRDDLIIMGHSLGGGIAFLYAATYPNEIKKYISIDIASPSVRCPKKMTDLLAGSVDKFLSYEKLRVEQMPCYTYEEMVDIVEHAHAGSVNRQGCKIMLRRGMKPAEHRDGYLFTRDPRLKISSLGFFTLDQVLLFASRIKCEVMNIRAMPGMRTDQPEHYDQVLDTIEMQAEKLERHEVEGKHHLHLNDARSIANLIYSFILS